MVDLLALQLERSKLNSDWARFTAERLQKAILAKKIGATGSLAYSILYRVNTLNGEDTSILHEFNFYGKFVDMGVGKGTKLGEWRDNAEVYREVGKNRRPKKWFSKTYYGQAAELRDLHLKKYGDQAVGVIKESLM